MKKKHYSQVSPSEAAQIVKLFTSGQNFSAVAEKFGRDWKTVARVVRAAQKRRDYDPGALPAAIAAEIAAVRGDGSGRVFLVQHDMSGGRATVEFTDRQKAIDYYAKQTGDAVLASRQR